MYRDDNLYLSDILESISAIQDFILNMSYPAYKDDRKTQSATIREFMVVGEAISKISVELKQEFSEVNWQEIKDFRNFLIHDYFGIDDEIVWDAIQNELPILKEQISRILARKQK